MNISDYFDVIYIIHLDTLTERKYSIIKQIQKFQLKNIVIIDAINKNEINNIKLRKNELIAYGGNKYCKTAIINDRGDKCWCQGNGHNDVCDFGGRVACAYSHYFVYKDILEKGYKKCLILEDDFVLEETLHQLFHSVFDDIPKNWELLYFCNSRFINLNGGQSEYNNSFVKTKNGLVDSGCYAITETSAKIMFDNFFPIRAASDGYIGVCIDRLFKITEAYVCKKSLSRNGSLAGLRDSANDNIVLKENDKTETENLNNELRKLVKQYNKIDIDTIYSPKMNKTVIEQDDNKRKNVISFCLYGCHATYIIGMKENINLAKEHYPNWEVRIHYNSTVPEKFIEEYREMGAKCILCENIGVNKMNWEGMFWRWLPLNDKNVDFWISRDADSRLSQREADIVKEWMNSGKTLHCIRDHRCHMHCIMGGMFGINNILFNEKYQLKSVKEIIKENYEKFKERPYNIDQIFLNEKIWNLLHNDVIAHISNQGRRVYDSDIEIPRANNFIGQQYPLRRSLIQESANADEEDLVVNSIFKIKSKYTENYFDIIDNRVRLKSKSNEKTQLWTIDENNAIKNLSNGLYLDYDNKNDAILSSKFDKSQNSWTIQQGGFIMNKQNMALDFKGGLKDKRLEVWMFKSNFTEAQQWDFILQSPLDGVFKIKSKNTDNYLSVNESKIVSLKKNEDIDSQYWTYSNNKIVSLLNDEFLDIKDKDIVVSKNENVSWTIEEEYIVHSSKNAIDVKGGLNDRRKEVWLYNLNYSDAQKWEFESVTTIDNVDTVKDLLAKKEEKVYDKVVVSLQDKMHHKNKRGLEMICEHLNYKLIYGGTHDINAADVVYSPGQPFDVRQFPTKRFVFGPQLSIMPNFLLQRIHNTYNNSIYIQPSPWARDAWLKKGADRYLPIQSFPFPVDTNKFTPGTGERKNVLIYFKKRGPEKERLVYEKLNSMNETYKMFRYGFYEEEEYLKYLKTCKYGIWLGTHESQGFGLEEVLSCNVPLLVWNAQNMKDQWGWDTAPDMPATTVSYWDERCGEYFNEKDEFDSTYEKFIKNLNSYTPREFVIDTVGIEKCSQRFKETFFFDIKK